MFERQTVFSTIEKIFFSLFFFWVFTFDKKIELANQESSKRKRKKDKARERKKERKKKVRKEGKKWGAVWNETQEK